jgi:hypothetical protein
MKFHILKEKHLVVFMVYIFFGFFLTVNCLAHQISFIFFFICTLCNVPNNFILLVFSLPLFQYIEIYMDR